MLEAWLFAEHFEFHDEFRSGTESEAGLIDHLLDSSIYVQYTSVIRGFGRTRSLSQASRMASKGFSNKDDEKGVPERSSK